MEIIDFLNDYNGFVISILTSILVIATIWYARVTKKILRVNEQTHIETTRPYVLVSFEGVNDGLEFSLKNFGKTAAYKTTILIDPPLDNIDMLLREKSKRKIKYGHKPMLNQQFLPPDFEVKTVLQFSQDFVKNDELDRVFNIKIDYQNYEEKKFSTEYTVDISSILYGDKIKSYSNGYYLKGIKENLISINKLLNERR